MMKTNTVIKQVITSVTPPENSIRILLVEDDKINRFLNSKILSKIGFEIEVAGDSDEALKWLHQQHFDLVLMDIRLPGMDGIELTEYIRNNNLPFSDIPIFALTSSTIEEVRIKAMRAGMNEYFTKPYNTIELQQLIMNYVKK